MAGLTEHRGAAHDKMDHEGGGAESRKGSGGKVHSHETALVGWEHGWV